MHGKAKSVATNKQTENNDYNNSGNEVRARSPL